MLTKADYTLIDKVTAIEALIASERPKCETPAQYRLLINKIRGICIGKELPYTYITFEQYKTFLKIKYGQTSN